MRKLFVDVKKKNVFLYIIIVIEIVFNVRIDNLSSGASRNWDNKDKSEENESELIRLEKELWKEFEENWSVSGWGKSNEGENVDDD